MIQKYLRKGSKDLFWLSWLGIPYLIWLYSIATVLHKEGSHVLRRIVLFALITYPSLYVPVGLTLLLSGHAGMSSIMPFHLAAILCIFCLMLIASLTIRRFEKEAKLRESNWFGIFFGLWYFFFGIWYIQPKLNDYAKIVLPNSK